MTTPAGFTEWLTRHCGERTPVGDLADDVARDPDWPGDQPYDELRSYLDERDACPDAVDALHTAWLRYGKARRRT